MRANAGRDANWRALPRVQVSLGGELVVGGGDDAARDAELGGEAATRRQAHAGLEASLADGFAKGALDLLVERQAAVAVKRQEQVNWPLRMTHKLALYARPALA